MNYHFVFEKSNEDIPTLLVYRDDGMYMFGTTTYMIVKVITGERAIQLFNELTGKTKEADNDSKRTY